MSDGMTPFEESEQQSPDDGKQTQGRDQQATSAGDRRWRSPGSWIGGAILIVLGLVFLAQNLGMTVPILQNWWAVFIFIPAVGALNTAWQAYQRNGRRFTSSVSGSLIGGLAMMLVALTFLLGWSWGVIWPVFMILAGLVALASGVFTR